MNSTGKKISNTKEKELWNTNTRIPFEMMTASQLNDVLLKKNKISCVNCFGFLWPPIMHGREGNICGNCWSDSNTSYIRNTLLENILEHLLIPCTFYENGCKEQDYYSNMLVHVDKCVYRNLNCPMYEIIPECPWKGCYYNIVNHFREQHSSFIIRSETESLSFPVLLSKIKDLKLIFIPSGIFLLFLSYDQDCLKIFCNFYHIFNYGFKSFDFCIEQNIKGNSSLISYKTSISNVRSIWSLKNKNSHLLNDVEIDLNLLKGDLMKEKGEFTLKVESRVLEKKKSINKDMLKFIECPICFNYMKSPIHQCLTGHSVCDTCKKKSSYCPLCKSYFQNTRNFALEQLINDLESPCIYKEQGCAQWCSEEEKEIHEENCYFKLYTCPLKHLKSGSCDWSGKYDQLIPHLKKAHRQQTYESSEVILNWKNNSNNFLFCLIAYKEVFLVNCKSDYYNCYDANNWTIQFFGPGQKRKYYIPEIVLESENVAGSKFLRVFLPGDFSKSGMTKTSIPGNIISWFAFSYMEYEVVRNNYRICGGHFQPTNFFTPDGTKLVRNVVPSVFPDQMQLCLKEEVVAGHRGATDQLQQQHYMEEEKAHFGESQRCCFRCLICTGSGQCKTDFEENHKTHDICIT